MPPLKITLWSGLTLLFLRLANYAEKKLNQAKLDTSKSEQEEADSGDDLTLSARSNGIPEHWLTMVKQHAPGFLHRLEMFSFKVPQMNQGKTDSEQSVASDIQKPDHLGVNNSASKSDVVQKIESFQADYGLTKISNENRGSSGGRLVIRSKNRDNPTEIVNQSTKQSDESKPMNRIRLRIEPKLESISTETFQSDQINVHPATILESINVASESVADRKMVLPDLPEITVNPSKLKTESTENSSVKIDHVQSLTHSLMQTSPVRQKVSTAQIDQPANKYIDQSTTQTKHLATKTDHHQSQITSINNENISSDNFWPNLSGLDKKLVMSDQWPELPEDAWNELWGNKGEEANISSYQVDERSKDNLWNG